MKKSLLILTSVVVISNAAINQISGATPQVTCPAAATVECGESTTLTATVSDADGDALVAVWALGGVPFQTNQVAAGVSSNAAAISFTGSLPLGSNDVTITVTDSGGSSASCTTTINVVDTTPPVIESVSTTPKRLWPPNHKLLPIIVKATVTDTCGPATWKIVSVASNESENG